MILGPPDAPDAKTTLSLSSRTITGLILDCGLFPGSVPKIDVNGGCSDVPEQQLS